MAGEVYFSPELFAFLTELRMNNNRQWFLANKDRYEAVVRAARSHTRLPPCRQLFTGADVRCRS